MGIRATFETDAQTVNLADDMLAKVLADYSAKSKLSFENVPEAARAEVTANFVEEQFNLAEAANAVLAGGKLPFTLGVNGQLVVRGHIGIFPEKLLLAALAGKKTPLVEVKWHWEAVPDTALEKVIKAYVEAERTLRQIRTAEQFISLVINAREDPGALLRFLLMRYAMKSRHANPRLMKGIREARKLYRIYRRIGLAERLLGGGKGGDATGDEPNVLAWIASELRDRSPVVSGDYSDAHELYADGEFFADAADVTEDMDDLPEAEEWSFTNSLPYSRKIEMGKTKAGRDFVIQVPPNIYERVAEDAQSRFGDLAEIRFEMRALLGGEQVNQSKAASTRPARSASGVRESRLGKVHGQTAHNNPDVRFPTIIVRFQ